MNIGTTIFDSHEGIRLSKELPGVYAVAGIHPHNADHHSQENLSALVELAHSGDCVALGEVGLDYYRNEWPKEMQQALFQDAISIANEARLPLVIHTRNAFSDTMDALKSARVPVVLHCFEGGEDEFREAAERGYYIGLTGNITYKNNPTADFLHLVPEDRLMVETDAPYLSPMPLRGKPNAPKNIVHTARFIAGRLGVSEQDLAERTTNNAREFYGMETAKTPPGTGDSARA